MCKVTLLIPEGRFGYSFRRGHLNIHTNSSDSRQLKHHENRHGQMLASLTDQDFTSLRSEFEFDFVLATDLRLDLSL